MSKSESRKANKHLAFRMTPEEHDAVFLASFAHGMGMSTFARRAAFRAAELAAPEYERKRNPFAADAARILGQLGRMASSANQIAKLAHATGDLRGRVAVFALVDELKAFRAEVLRAGEDA
ncbi:MAG: hypothetical protein E5Y31_20960 [Mesorhizobium sp.]|nr:MAG: hypothetical protein E5Y31_20960 [Mesorhizobium sp.]